MSQWNEWDARAATGDWAKPHYGFQEWRTVTTTTTINPEALDPLVRRIVREELADIMPIDVPDAPPEDMA